MRYKVLFIIILTYGTLFSQAEVNSPNVFTPNGDSINDVFTLITNNVSTLNCKIFNRWGEIVCEFHGVNGFWDGYLPSGDKAAEGVYFYVITYNDDEALEQTKNGNLHLLR